jgi:hypothetical protein
MFSESCSKVSVLLRCDVSAGRSSIFIRDKPIFSSERMLHKDYDYKGSSEKKKSPIMSLKELGAKTN